MGKILFKYLGISYVLKLVWEAIKPELEEWAKSDGKEDWDDKLVEFLDKLVKSIIEGLESEGK